MSRIPTLPKSGFIITNVSYQSLLLERSVLATNLPGVSFFLDSKQFLIKVSEIHPLLPLKYVMMLGEKGVLAPSGKVARYE